MLGFPKSTLGRIGFFVVLGAMSQACSSTDDSTTEGTGGSAGSGQAGSTAEAGDTGKAGGAGERSLEGGAGGETATEGGAGGETATEGGAAGETAAEGGAAGEPVAEGGAAGEPVAEGGAAGEPVAEGGAAGEGGEPVVGGLVKFCNSLSLGDEAVNLTIRINEVELVADSGTCAPVLGCTGIDAGENIDVVISDGVEDFNTYTVPVIYDGDELLITTDLDADSMPMPSVNFAAGICSGGDATAGTVAKFCNYLVRTNDAGEAEDFVATLNIDGTTIEAASGTCTPIASCTAIPAGTSVPISVLDGTEEIASYTWEEIAENVEMIFELSYKNDEVTLSSTEAAGVCAPVMHKVISLSDAAESNSPWKNVGVNPRSQGAFTSIAYHGIDG